MAARTRFALFAAVIAFAMMAAAYVYLHRPFAVNSPVLSAVALSETDPALERVGDLIYRGGIDIPRMDRNIGGLSALRWDAKSGRLLALTDDARWVWIVPDEPDGELSGLENIDTGELLGPDGATLIGKEQGDSESVTRSAEGGWLIGFERDHRIWRYPSLTGPPAPPAPMAVQPETVLGPLENNSGVEALAGDENSLFLCAEQVSLGGEPNCAAMSERGVFERQTHQAPEPLLGYGAAPTDADMAADGTLYILFRSYSKLRGNDAAIIAIDPNGARRDLAVLASPLTVDNFEGIAVREDDGRSFLYIVSDDNFSADQRTLLMKFEISRD
ncbi:esterase-like activity of phytase family protein [Erythrobacter sp. MTPC3]|uniref:esterase-like activity of phytase family protein n=1 Tax=Erythrobacter sp. MTPC3 TaxID=3056564 RepID=UPI0036F44330